MSIAWNICVLCPTNILICVLLTRRMDLTRRVLMEEVN